LKVLMSTGQLKVLCLLVSWGYSVYWSV